MTGYEFIFSDKGSARVSRHLVFWLTCWLYASLTYYIIQQNWRSTSNNSNYITPGTFILLKTFLLVVVYTIPCYAFTSIILPDVIKKNWFRALVLTLTIVAFMYGIGWLMYWKLFPYIDFLFGLHKEYQYFTKFWPAVVLGMIEPLKIIVAAAGIKYAKQWWNRQKEKENLDREKLSAELQLLKAQMSPSFLFNALETIYERALVASPETPDLLIKLSDLLSYMLYECDSTFVPLDKELERMEDFMMLKKLSLKNNVETGLRVSGDVGGKTIAPFLLLPFIESGFRQSSKNPEHAWLNVDIDITKEYFTMKVASSTDSTNQDKGTSRENELNNVRKRLSLLYPLNHELKISWEAEMFLILLKINTTMEKEESGIHNQLISSLA